MGKEDTGFFKLAQGRGISHRLIVMMVVFMIMAAMLMVVVMFVIMAVFMLVIMFVIMLMVVAAAMLPVMVVVIIERHVFPFSVILSEAKDLLERILRRAAPSSG